MSAIRKFHPVLLALIMLAGMARGEESPATRVIILANRDDPDSLRVARHYAEARAVPPENIIAQAMPLAETISWDEFVATVWQPLQDELVRRKWIDAIPMTLTDAVGRKKYAISGHRISYLVVCRGVPLRIAHSAARYVKPSPQSEWSEYRIDLPEYQTNEGAIDSELTLLPQSGYPINAHVRNPLYGNDHPSRFDLNQIVKVSRLDGPTAEDAMTLVDRALEAERTGLLGRAYVDYGGNYAQADRWLKAAVAQLAELGLDTGVDATPSTFSASARFDVPVIYLGLYAGNVNGPFNLPGFRFPAGAIAEHIYSYSAATLRSANTGWCGPFIARGVTATVGNVFEPYLGCLHRPDMLVHALARGDTFGDAAYYAEPLLSWQAIAVGDPLYRPFAVSFENQWKNRAGLPPALAGYAALRKMNLLETVHKPDEALATGDTTMMERPNLALGFALALRREKSGDTAGAVRELAFAGSLPGFRPDEWALVHEAAGLLHRVGAPANAVQLYLHLLRDPALPAELRVPWLREAGRAAIAAGETAQAAEWTRELDELAPETIK